MLINNYLKRKWVECPNQKTKTAWMDTKTRPLYMLSTRDPPQTKGHIQPGGLQSMGSLGVGHDWVTSLSLFTFLHWRRKWQPTPGSCLENPRDGGAWWAAVYGVAQSRTRLKRLSSSSSRSSRFSFRFVIAFLPSKHLLISWLQSQSVVILEPKKIKSVTVSFISLSICHEVMWRYHFALLKQRRDIVNALS